MVLGIDQFLIFLKKIENMMNMRELFLNWDATKANIVTSTIMILSEGEVTVAEYCASKSSNVFLPSVNEVMLKMIWFTVILS